MIKKFTINKGPILKSYGVWVNFNCRKRPPVNSASQVALCDLDPAGTGSQRKLQLAVRAVHKRAAA
jgi:hypothetical protein